LKSEQNLFIFEFISGGGFNKENIPSSLFCEGYGMLKSIIEDFSLIGFKISTLLDNRIHFLRNDLNVKNIKFIHPSEDYNEKFSELAENNDFILIIAPEFDNILYNLNKIVEKLGKENLGVNLEAIDLGTHKLKTYKFFNENHVNTPITFKIPWKENTLDIDFIKDKMEELGTSIIIKPEDGVGAESIFIIDNLKELNDFIIRFNTIEDKSDNYILQEFIKGENLSISLIGTGENPIILSINSQIINLDKKNKTLQYLGGFTPIKNFKKLKKLIQKELNKLNFSNFCGYFGIDFILEKSGKINLIEINPRLTTSYLGIKKATEKNLANLIYNSHMGIIKSQIDLKFKYFSHYRKLELKYKGAAKKEKLNKTIIPNILKNIPELITPLISLEEPLDIENPNYSCLIATKCKTFLESEKRIEEIKNKFKTLGFIGSS